MAVDNNGNVYIADANNHRIQKLDAANSYTATTIAGTTGQTGTDANHLNFPFGVAVDNNGNVYIADANNSRIQKLERPEAIDPTINITSPTNNATIPNGTTLTAAFTCTDADSGISTCTTTLNGTTIINGATIPTTTAGPNTLIVTAVDNAANTTTTTVNFTIAAEAVDPTIQPALPKYGPREVLGPYPATSGNNGAIARLYMSTFTRQPDSAGHTYWTESGLSLTDVAYLFVNGPEFKTTYNDLVNQSFVELLYNNVMNRTGEPAGVTYWTKVLDNGISRATVLLLFSESAEFKMLTKTS